MFPKFKRTQKKKASRTTPSASVKRELIVDGIRVVLTTKRIKNVNLRVKPGGYVSVSAPPWVQDRQVEAFVREKRAWIEQKQRTLEAKPQHLVDQADPAQIALWRSAVEAAAPALVSKWEPIMGVKAQKLAYRSMTSRWGSCNPATGRICINIQLANFPPECLEYVVVHELCHLLERGHGPRFKTLMDEFLPDWRSRRALLR